MKDQETDSQHDLVSSNDKVSLRYFIPFFMFIQFVSFHKI